MFEEAVKAAEQAVNIRRKLSEEDSSYIADLVDSASYLGVDLGNIGLYGQAVRVTQAAITIRRKLAEEDSKCIAALAYWVTFHKDLETKTVSKF